jgi:hypothetical protein
MNSQLNFNEETATFTVDIPNCQNCTRKLMGETKKMIKGNHKIKHIDITLENMGDKYEAEKTMSFIAENRGGLYKNLSHLNNEQFVKHRLKNYYNHFEFILWLQKQGFHDVFVEEGITSLFDICSRNYEGEGRSGFFYVMGDRE